MGRLPADIVLLVSDRSSAGALDKALARGIATSIVRPKDFDTPDRFGPHLVRLLQEHETTFVALAGYLKKIPSVVVQTFRNRILNIHPALLPAFGGKGLYGGRVHEAVLAYGVRWTGATVHLVDDSYDTGPVVLQYPVPVLQGDDAGSLAERVLDVEHVLYPEALRLFAQEKVRVEGRRVVLEEMPPILDHSLLHIATS
jgi:phosphoribosylglycinamide formyltransferase-1